MKKHFSSLKWWIKQFRLYRRFFISTLPVSIPGALAFAFLSSFPPVSIPGPLYQKFFISLPTAGLALDALNKEMTRKDEYFFYYNQGISKVHLWGITFIITALCSFITCQIVNICLHAWK